MMMTETLPSWSREYFTSGGGDAYLFYVVFGRIDTTASPSRSKHRIQGVPSELEIMGYGPSAHPEVVDSFREGHLWDELHREDPSLAQSVADQDQCLVFRGSFSDPETLDYLRDTVGLITHFLDHGGVAIYDPQMFKWWSPEGWRESIFDPAGPVPRHHTVILVSEDIEGTEWLHTRGLRKFGRPDISVPRVPSDYKDQAVELCDRFITLQALGGVIPEGKSIQMDSLPEGMKCYHRGHIDDPDFNNVHVSIE